MTVVALGSARGSPGVTTSAVVLAAVWPERPVAVVELDPDGGVLGARCGLGVEPGLTTLAAAARRDGAEVDAEHHLQELPGGVTALVAPTSAEQVHAALGSAAGIVRVLRGLDGTDVLLDCGRLGPGAPSAAVLPHADLTLLVARPRVDELHHVLHRARALAREATDLALLLVGDRPYPPGEVSAATGLEVSGVLAHDPRHAELVATSRPAGSLGRSPLVRSARSVATSLADRLATRTPEGRDSDPPGAVEPPAVEPGGDLPSASVPEGAVG